MQLASYACDPLKTQGRRYAETPAPTRNEYQRDRDRIVHSSAFRRLVYKTQVFLNHEGDLFRTRLTHSLEVAQLGRSIARSLHLNEDLVEAICLAHDLGHTPFGHAGQDALNNCMRAYGGFEHNFQSLRVVDRLEQRYPLYDGINLTFETREGILKHCSQSNAHALEAKEPNGVGYRFLHNLQPSLEAQLCNLADEIAYNAHDVDDGVRSGLISLIQLQAVPLFNKYYNSVLSDYPDLSKPDNGRRLLYETIRRMLSAQIYNVIDTTKEILNKIDFKGLNDIRCYPVLLQFDAEMRMESTELKQFLFRNLYRHSKVIETTEQAQCIVKELFSIYFSDPLQMKSNFKNMDDSERTVARRVSDYIAGMTDRFAVREYTRLTGRKSFSLE